MLTKKSNLSLVAAVVFAVFVVPGLRAAEQPKTMDAEQCIALLKSGASRKEKADACMLLGRIGGPSAVAPLLALLPDPELSHMARYALEPIPAASVDSGFREALEKLSGRPLVGVIGSIGVRGDTQAVPALAKMLNHEDPEVRQAAARTLGRLATPTAAKALEKARETAAASDQPAFCEGLFRIASARMADGKSNDAIAIYEVVRKSGPSLAYIRTAAWRGEILARGDSGISLLSEALRSDDRAVFSAGVRAAVELPGTAVTRELMARLNTLPAEKQVMLIDVLAKRQDIAATPCLIEAASRSDKAIQIAAVRGLAELNDAEAVPALAGLVTAADQDVASAAREGLASLQFPIVDLQVRGWLNGTDDVKRLVALEMVGRRRMSTLLPEMFQLATAANPEIRGAALKRIGEIGGADEIPKALDLLVAVKTAPERDAAEATVTALCVTANDPDSSATQVKARFAKADAAQKAALLRILATVGGPAALATIRTSVTDSQSDVRQAAIRALAGWNSPEVAPDLLNLAQSTADSAEKAISFRAYLRIAGQSDMGPKQRLDMCQQAAALAKKQDEKRLLVSTLGNINSPEAVKRISAYLEDPEVVQEACTAAVNLAEKLVEQRNLAKGLVTIAPVLDQVAAKTANADLAKRARAAAEKAKAFQN